MKPIRIGTRDSQLALWQAETVQYQLELLGYPTEIVGIKSEGDLERTTPLYSRRYRAKQTALRNGGYRYFY